MIAPPSRTSAWWTSIVCWFRQRTTSGSSPWERRGSKPPRTWVHTCPPRITLWYEEYVHVCRPLLALILAKDSAVDDTPSPAAPPTRRARSRFGIDSFLWGYHAVCAIPSHGLRPNLIDLCTGSWCASDLGFSPGPVCVATIIQERHISTSGKLGFR